MGQADSQAGPPGRGILDHMGLLALSARIMAEGQLLSPCLYSGAHLSVPVGG